MASPKTYKALVDQIIAIESKETYDAAYGAIENAYQHGEKITFADHEQLFRLLAKVGRFYGHNI